MIDKATLNQFTGTLNYFKHALTGYLYTDGVEYVAREGKAYWLIDKILLTMKYEAKMQSRQRQEFSFWKLRVNLEEQSAILTCDNGNGKIVWEEKIEYTNFELPEIDLWFENQVLILPSEH